MLASAAWIVAILTLAPSCTDKHPPATDPPAPNASAVTEGAEAQAGEASAGEACSAAKAKGPLAWFSDDYPAALACARASKRPIVIDLWAPWCHTCLSMKHTVLIDNSLEPLADRYVWLELDTDKETNASALARFPPRVWPTFYVVSPDESVQASFLGAASIGQFRAFVAQGESAFLAQAGDLPADSPLALIRDGDRAMVQSEWTGARTAYGQAVAKLAKDSPRRPDVLVSLISAYYRSEDYPGCLAVAEANLDATGNTASAADFLYYAQMCASKLTEGGGGEPAGGAARRKTLTALRKRALARLTALIDDSSARMSLDDRAEAMRIARVYLAALGDEAGARAMAERQRTFLDGAAEAAPNPFAAMTFNWPRAEVYVYLRRAAELIPALQKSVADLPNEYDPPYRLAWVQHQIGNDDEAQNSAETALALAYGPRKARVQALLADIHKARGDRAAELAARQAVVALYKTLPQGQQQPGLLDDAEKALAAVAGE